MDIPGAIREVFGFFRANEENRDIKFLQKLLKSQARAIDAAEQYINADEDLATTEEPTQVRQLIKMKTRQKARFRKYN